jgi:hypothetical protein
MKIRLVGAEFFHVGEETDGRTEEGNSRFGSSTNARKIFYNIPTH